MNRQWVLDHYPDGAATVDTWRMVESPMPEPGPRQILVRTLWLSLDPYMRGRISPAKNYTAGVQLGGVMHGGGVGEVIASNHPDWRVGDIAESMNINWQEFAVLSPEGVNKVPADVPPQASLSWLGMPGLTAFIGLTEIGRPLPGETVVISAASGAVGQVAGQIATLMGARAIAVAGDDEKIDYCRSIGFAGGINYKRESDLPGAIARVCPDGVDVFFDNTGGPIHDAVLANLAVRARVIICGRIAVIDKAPSEDIGLRSSARLIVTRATVQGLVVFDWWHRRPDALKHLAGWHREGRIRFKEDILDGFERVPEAFIRMMSGQNQGKQLVRLK
ncbi:MAG: NADP-dependent oxidoreductase [Flavobacteriaceae bacterium]